VSTPFDASSEDIYEPGQDPEEATEQEAAGANDDGVPAAATEAPLDPLLSTLPPEAQGETNGGPLGCCLGTVAGLFLTLLVLLSISIAIGNGGYLGWATGPVALIGALGGGYTGWRIGKLIYREYELSPQRRARLERVEQQWNSKQQRSNRVRHPKIG
jgi:hypothetical protein